MSRKGVDGYQEMSWSEIHHGAYLREGHLAAMPLGFSGVSTPIDANDSFITSLTVGPGEVLYGGTSGRSAHVFVAGTRGATGAIVDLGGDGESSQCAGLVCTKEKIIVAVNGKRGGRILSRPVDSNNGFSDCIQEWAFDLSPFKMGCELPEGETVVDLIPDISGNGVIGTTNAGLFTWVEGTDKPTFYRDFKIAHLTIDRSNNIYGVSKTGQLYLIDYQDSVIQIRPGDKISGSFEKYSCWSRTNPKGTVYLTDANGQIFSVNNLGKAERVCRTHLEPVTCMTVTNDGRLFGFCGHGMANLFVYEPKKATVRDLGVAISVINRRRYGYEFACAVTNRDGEIYFGENDRGGHLWVYYPTIE